MEKLQNTSDLLLFIAFDNKPKNKRNKALLLHKKRLKPRIFRFLDPYQNYRLYGDIILSNKLLKNDKETIYSFELYKDYKALRQIHISEHGIILELEDFDENEIVCTSFVKSRLKSLGDEKASNFADFLDNYDEYFKEDQKYLKYPSITQNHSQTKIISIIEDIFHKHQEDAVFIRGNKMLTNKDSRTRYICYNFLMLEWITHDKNPFSDEFISNCFKIFFFKDLEEFVNMLKNIILKKKQQTSGILIIPKFINTIAGKIFINFEVDTHFIQKEGIIFHSLIHSKKYQDSTFLQNIQKNKENFEEKMKKNIEVERKASKCYSELIKLYYLNKKL